MQVSRPRERGFQFSWCLTEHRTSGVTVGAESERDLQMPEDFHDGAGRHILLMQQRAARLAQGVERYAR